MIRSQLPAASLRLAKAAFAACLLAVLVLTLMPVSIPDHFAHEDKVHHILAFMALAILASAAWNPPAWKLIVSLVALGGAIEVAQYFIPNRSCELADLEADTVGAIVGWAVYPLLLAVFLKWQARRNS